MTQGWFTLRWSEDWVEMLDQRLLPEREEYLQLTTAEQVACAIEDLAVRGAPAIGCAAGLGVALAAVTSAADDVEGIEREVEAAFERLALEAAAQDADQIEARLEAILAFDARPLAPNLAGPALVATAADDQLMPAWFGTELAGLIPDASHLALDGGGHMLPETRGQELAAAISDFLAA